MLIGIPSSAGFKFQLARSSMLNWFTFTTNLSNNASSHNSHHDFWQLKVGKASICFGSNLRFPLLEICLSPQSAGAAAPNAAGTGQEKRCFYLGV